MEPTPRDLSHGGPGEAPPCIFMFIAEIPGGADGRSGGLNGCLASDDCGACPF